MDRVGNGGKVHSTKWGWASFLSVADIIDLVLSVRQQTFPVSGPETLESSANKMFSFFAKACLWEALGGVPTLGGPKEKSVVKEEGGPTSLKEGEVIGEVAGRGKGLDFGNKP